MFPLRYRIWYLDKGYADLVEAQAVVYDNKTVHLTVSIAITYVVIHTSIIEIFLFLRETICGQELQHKHFPKNNINEESPPGELSEFPYSSICLTSPSRIPDSPWSLSMCLDSPSLVSKGDPQYGQLNLALLGSLT